LESFVVTESISGISDLSPAMSGGTGSAKDTRGNKRFRNEDDHDIVTISDEARRRPASKETELDIFEEG
jgi:hypothetical protein